MLQWNSPTRSYRRVSPWPMILGALTGLVIAVIFYGYLGLFEGLFL